MSTVVIICTLNEIDGLKKIVPDIKKEWAEEWLFVDGGSNDGTVEEAKRQRYEVIFQKGKGLGDAYREGVQHSKSKNILFFAPDGNDEVDDIPRLIKKINEGYDMVHISRFGKNSTSDDAGPVTYFGNKMFTFLVNVLFGGKYTDAINGYRIIKRDKLASLKLNADFETYEEQTCIRILKKSFKIFEIDGNEPNRVGGERKMRPLHTGIDLCKMIILEFIFWKF